MAGDKVAHLRPVMAASFNSRPRMAGDPALRGEKEPASSFNSRPRMAGDESVVIIHKAINVSIHARAWRAT